MYVQLKMKRGTFSKFTLCVLAILVCGTFLLNKASARQFRLITPITTPEKVPEGAVRLERFSPVNRDLVISAVYALADAWNTGNMAPMLSEQRFYNKYRLLDTITDVAPYDAVLKIQSVGGITTLEQYVKPKEGRRRQVSIVSAIVRTQIEFNDPNTGFIQLHGRNEFVLEIEQAARENPS